MAEFPKKISENGWYELSNGETVRGEDAARQAEADLQDAADPAEDELHREVEVEEDPVDLADPRTAEQGGEGLEGKTCANCDNPAVAVDDVRRTVNKVYYCYRHLPEYMR